MKLSPQHQKRMRLMLTGFPYAVLLYHNVLYFPELLTDTQLADVRDRFLKTHLGLSKLSWTFLNRLMFQEQARVLWHGELLNTGILLQKMAYNILQKFIHNAKFAGIPVIETPHYTVISGSAGNFTLSSAYWMRFDAKPLKQHVAEVSAHFPGSFIWWISPNDTPHLLHDHLQKFGHRLVSFYYNLYCRLDQSFPDINVTPLDIVQVSSAQHVHDYCAILRAHDHDRSEDYFERLNNLPLHNDPEHHPDQPFIYYLGYHEGKPVVLGHLFFTEDIVSVYDFVTHPDHRQKGYAGALLQRMMRDAADTKARYITLSTYQLWVAEFYYKFGFSMIYGFRVLSSQHAK
jgi:GNAT superfamily N-acetyltransferase